MVQNANRGQSRRSHAEAAALVQANYPLAWNVAGKFCRKAGVDFEDALSICGEALWRAAQLYDPGHHSGARFSTYACWSMIRKLSHYGERKWMIQARREGQRLLPVEGEYVDLLDTIPDPLQTEPAEALEEAERQEQLGRALTRLPGRIRLILRGRLRGLTLERLGLRLGLSKERVRQLEARGHELLREVLTGLMS
jgi:RNA polymerase sigma factor (sigma-70 family)